MQKPPILHSPSGRVGPPMLHFYEAWEDAKGALQMRDGIVPNEKVDDWLHLEGDYRVGGHVDPDLDQSMVIRLIACDFDQHPFAIGCGHDTFETIRKAFQLHESSEEAILNNNGAFGRYFLRSPNASDIDSFALVFKVANHCNIGYESLSMTYDLNRRTTRAFIHGYLDEETSRLIAHLRTHKDTPWPNLSLPLRLPARIFQCYRRKAEAYRVSIDDNLVMTEVRIGYAIPGVLETNTMTKPDQQYINRGLSVISGSEANIEFEAVTRKLHSFATELGSITHVARLSKDLGSFLCTTARELEEILYKPDEKKEIQDSRVLADHLQYLTTLFTTLISQTSTLKDRVQNHINLTYSLTAQDENRISRLVAEESALVAVATKRDSAAMKTIALLTIIFLPPTFVAAFYSMPMFTYSSPTHLWIYFSTAIPLTILVLLIWRLWILREEKTYREEMRLAKAKKARDSNMHFPGVVGGPQRELPVVADLMRQYSNARSDNAWPYHRHPWRHHAKTTMGDGKVPRNMSLLYD